MHRRNSPREATRMWRKKVRAIWGNADLERRFDQVGPGTVLGLGRVCIREPSRSAAQIHHRLFGNVRAVVVQYDANMAFGGQSGAAVPNACMPGFSSTPMVQIGGGRAPCAAPTQPDRGSRRCRRSAPRPSCARSLCRVAPGSDAEALWRSNRSVCFREFFATSR